MNLKIQKPNALINYRYVFPVLECVFVCFPECLYLYSIYACKFSGILFKYFMHFMFSGIKRQKFSQFKSTF